MLTLIFSEDDDGRADRIRDVVTSEAQQWYKVAVDGLAIGAPNHNPRTVLTTMTTVEITGVPDATIPKLPVAIQARLERETDS